MAGIVDIMGRVALAMKNASGVMAENNAANPVPTSERGGLAASATFTPNEWPSTTSGTRPSASHQS